MTDGPTDRLDRDADVIVIGAGAAGLMAAAEAALRGRRTILLEKNQRPGLKILISGGGRCNLTTTRRGKDLEKQYGTARGRFLRHAIRSFTPQHLIDLVEAGGVALQEEDLEKIFPVSRKASDILRVFVDRATNAGAELRVGVSMLGLERDGDDLVVETSEGKLRAGSVVMATGGLSYPKTGATGDGYPVLKHFGHELTECVPALAPLKVDEPWLHQLQGLVLDAEIRVSEPSGRVLSARRRPCLVTHKGLSGPAPMDVSGFVEEHHGDVKVSLDVAPDRTREQVAEDVLKAVQAGGKKQVRQVLPTTIPERFRNALCERTGAETTCAELTKAARQELLASMKDLTLDCKESLGFKAAEVTRGGVRLEEIDARTMQSKKDPNLYVCGELLDVDGPIGGFNFQAAFATGRLAGRHA